MQAETALHANALPAPISSVFSRQLLLTILFLSFFAWYIYPLGVIDYHLIVSKGFELVPTGLDTFAKSLEQDRLGLDEVPKLLVGMVGAGGLSMMLYDRRRAPACSAFFGLLLASIVLLAAFASVATYHMLVAYGHRLDAPFGTEIPIQDLLTTTTVTRFRELWVLISALAGLSLVVQHGGGAGDA